MSSMESNGRPAEQGRCCGPRLRWLVWGMFLVVWSAALLMPNPSRFAEPWLAKEAQYPTAKTLHVCAYGVLAILTGWLLVPPQARWFLLLFMSVHAFGTEGLQLLIPGRTGLITDVGFDHLGLYLGLLASWRWWRGPGLTTGK